MSKPKETIPNGAYTFLPNSSTDASPTQPRHRKLLKFVIPITLILCFATFALGFVLGVHHHPHDIKVNVAQASIQQYQLISNDTIHCKAALVMAFRNPNRMASVHYKRLYTSSYYERSRFGSMMLPKFHQGPESVKTFYPVFEGNARMPMNWRLEEYYQEKEDGFIDVEVRGYAWIKYKIGFFKTGNRIVAIVCRMDRVALASGESHGGGGFRGTRCDVQM